MACRDEQHTDSAAATPAREIPPREWNATRTDYPRESSIGEIFEAQARATPDAVALVFGNETLTYAALNRRADALARELISLGVVRETPVGLCAERSLELITALLAIVKAGGAYVPLDAAYPRERLEFMLADTAVPVLLTQRALLEKLPATSAHIVCLGEFDFSQNSAAGTPAPASAPEPRATAESLAYVMFTSGSTGAPKGVAVPHRAVVRLVKQTNYVCLTNEETILQLAPVSFDASTFEIWGALLNGGRLVIMPPGQPSLEDIGREIAERGVTTLWLTAGLFHVMIDQRAADLRPLRQLLAGGDALSPAHVRKALRELPRTRLINGYGPTESTTFALCHTIRADEPLENGVPIGKPIANTTARVFLTTDNADGSDGKDIGDWRLEIAGRDSRNPPSSISNLRPLPPSETSELSAVKIEATKARIGEAGELFIGGDGLARGYWRRPELTAEKFVTIRGERFYRTGDLARWRADGVVEFLGRMDNQVKIRGYRIELGEIESALAQLENVRDAVVVARERGGEKELLAYFIARGESIPSPAELRAALGEKLPAYMVPARFVRVESFPLTANGKVDRRALPEPAENLGAESFVAPQNELEETIAAIWREVLGAQRVGTRDNFFDIGGSSIRIVEAHSRLVRALRRPLPVTLLFQHPTIGALAKSLTAAPPAPGSAAVRDRARQQREALARKQLSHR